jgi:hypothetical protein
VLQRPISSHHSIVSRRDEPNAAPVKPSAALAATLHAAPAATLRRTSVNATLRNQPFSPTFLTAGPAEAAVAEEAAAAEAAAALGTMNAAFPLGADAWHPEIEAAFEVGRPKRRAALAPASATDARRGFPGGCSEDRAEATGDALSPEQTQRREQVTLAVSTFNSTARVYVVV